MAIAGALIAAPAAHAATRVPARATATAVRAVTDALVVHHEPARRYTVKPGDTLSSIAQRFYGSSARWNWLFQANRSVIKNPDMIFPGQVLSVPSKPPARATATATATAAAPARQTALTTSTTLSGTLSCRGLEELWEQAGGSQAEA